MTTPRPTVPEPTLLYEGQVHSLTSRNRGRLVSILIPVKNGAAQLRELLPRVLNQESEHRVEIVAVDSGSTDETVEVLQKHSATVVGIDPQSFNSGLTRTLATSYARGDVFVFVTHRTLPGNSHWLANLVAPLEADERIAGAYSRILPRPEADFLTLKDQLVWSPPTDPRVITNWADYQALDPRERRVFIWFSTVSAAVRPEVFARIPFREVKYNEDMLWAREVLEAGYKIKYEPSSIVLHSHNYTNSELLRRYFDDGIANREFVQLRLDQSEILARVKHEVRDDWHFIRQHCAHNASQCFELELDSILRRLAQTIGFWLGTNSDRLPGDIAELLSFSQSNQCSSDLQPFLTELGQSFSSGQSERVQGCKRLSEPEVLETIAAGVRDEWQSAQRVQMPGYDDLDEARIEIALRRIAQVVGLWLGTNSDVLPKDLGAWLSLVGRLRSGLLTNEVRRGDVNTDGAQVAGWSSSLAQSASPGETRPAVVAPVFDAATVRYVDALATALDLAGTRVANLETELHSKVAECNRVIRELQAELHTKVGERDQTIRALQAELQSKVTECNEVIRDLQSQSPTVHSQLELSAREAEQDGVIRELQAELHEKVGEANRVIADLQAEMHGKVGEANAVIRDLHGQLAAARVSLPQAAPPGATPAAGVVELSAGMLAERDQAIRALEAELTTLHGSRAWRIAGAYYRVRERLSAEARRLRRRAGRRH